MTDRRGKDRRYYLRHPERRMWLRAKIRAQRDGAPFSITPEDIVIPKRCPVLGMKLKAGARSGGDDCSPSLDRIVSSRGYVPGNVQVISHLANSMKQHATRAQLVRFAEWVLLNRR